MTTVVTIDQEGRYHKGKGILRVPFIIRGEVVDNYSLEIEGRDRGSGKITFQTPDLQSYLKTLVKVDTNDL